MNPLTRVVITWLLAALIAAAAFSPAVAARYVCPPCGLPCDTLSFAVPGICPRCGMTLVEAGSAAAQPPPAKDVRRVAFLLFDGVEVIDFSGPYEMFGTAGCDVYTVAATRVPVTTAMGLTVVPRYSFANAPAPDVLVVPGGGVYAACNDPKVLEFVRATSARARETLSVCNGAFILASAGLLDGLTATTTNGNIPKLAAQFPKVRVVRDRRVVDNGRIVTAAGLSAGIDGALHVIGNLFGTGVAEQVALAQEYDWATSATFARAALADHEIPALALDDWGAFTVVRTEGDTTRWEFVVRGHPKGTAAEFRGRLDKALGDAHWMPADSPAAGRGTPSGRDTHWRFTGSDGRPWTGTLRIGQGSDGDPALVSAEVAVARAG